MWWKNWWNICCIWNNICGMVQEKLSSSSHYNYSLRAYHGTYFFCHFIMPMQSLFAVHEPSEKWTRWRIFPQEQYTEAETFYAPCNMLDTLSVFCYILPNPSTYKCQYSSNYILLRSRGSKLLLKNKMRHASITKN